MDISNSKNEAYKEAMRFEKSKFDKEIIYAKLEKKGFTKEIAKDVARNIVFQRVQQNRKKSSNDFYNMLFILFCVGLVVSCVTYYFSQSFMYSFISFLTVGVPSIIFGFLMSTDELNFK